MIQAHSTKEDAGQIRLDADQPQERLIQKTLSNDELLERTHTLVKEERRIGIEVIQHLQEISRRKLYLKAGYPSLFQMCIEEFKYSPPAAQIRIDAMRLMNDVPELREKVEEGKISISVAAQVQTFLRRDLEQKRSSTGQNSASLEVTKHEKLELIESLEGKSSREVQKELVSRNPEASVAPDRVKQVTAEKFEMKISVSKEVFEKLEKVKALLSHKNSGDWESVLSEMAEIALKKLEPKQKETSTAEPKSLEVTLPDLSRDREGNADICISDVRNGAPRRTRFIRKSVKAKVWSRDEACCTYIDPKTQKRCGSKSFLQYDHIQSFALGGENTVQNLRLLCGAHNRARNERSYISVR